MQLAHIGMMYDMRLEHYKSGQPNFHTQSCNQRAYYSKSLYKSTPNHHSYSTIDCDLYRQHVRIVCALSHTFHVYLIFILSMACSTKLKDVLYAHSCQCDLLFGI